MDATPARLLDTDADAAAFTDLDFGFAHESRNETERRVVITGRCRLASAEQLSAPVVECDDFGFVAAAIDPDALSPREALEALYKLKESARNS